MKHRGIIPALLIGHIIMGLIIVSVVNYVSPDAIRTTFLGDWMIYIAITFLITFISVMLAWLTTRTIGEVMSFPDFLKDRWNNWK